MSLYSWGSNTSKEINESNQKAILEPYGPSTSLAHRRLQKVSAGHSHTLALDKNGDVLSWGGSSAALGLGIARRTPTSEPARVVLGGLGANRVIDIVAADGASAAITADGTLYEWGFLHAATTQGDNNTTTTANGDSSQPSVAMVGMAVREEARMSERLKQLLRASTVAYLTGKTQMIKNNSDDNTNNEQQEQEQPQQSENDTSHELDKDTIDAEAGILAVRTRRKMVLTPTRAHFHLPIARVALGYGHTLILTRDGQVYGKGYNDRGTLGNGTRINSYMFQRITALDHVKIVHIAAGNSHNIVIDEQGNAYSFGSNVLGQLGIGSSYSDRLVPTLIPTQWFNHVPVKTVSCGSYHSVILTIEGYAYTFGHSEYGQHGTGGDQSEGDFTHLARHWFVPRPLLPFSKDTMAVGNNNNNHGGGPVQLVDISCGTHFNMGLDRHAQVWTWGYGNSGTLGHGSKLRGTHPQIVESLMGMRALSISAGHKHACVIVEAIGDSFAMTMNTLFQNVVATTSSSSSSFSSDDNQQLHPIIQDNQQFKVHRFILQARCPLLLNVSLPKHSEIRVVKALVEYLYMDRCVSCPPHRILDLARLAKDLQLPRLEHLCKVMQAQKKALLFSGVDGDDLLKLQHHSHNINSTFKEDMKLLFLNLNAHSNSSSNTRSSVVTFRCIVSGHGGENKSTTDVIPRGHTSFSWYNHSGIIILPSSSSSMMIKGHTQYSLGEISPIVKAHRVLLERYPFFSVMLSDDFMEGQAVRDGIEVMLHDVNPIIFREIVLWCYAGDTTRVQQHNVCALVETATRFGMEDLSACCESFLCELVRQQTDIVHVQGLYEFANRIGVLPKLKREAKGMLKEMIVKMGGVVTSNNNVTLTTSSDVGGKVDLNVINAMISDEDDEGDDVGFWVRSSG
jgi:alpha-tubulin suppressor-like RCC1 family protein